MKRNIEKELLFWKNSTQRLPLIVRGARQVGKSYTIESFGRQHFNSLIVVNFELNPELMACFDSLDPDIIIAKLALMTNQPIQEGQSLLFFDEIQQCPKALLSMRYFKEKKPALHVIAAGSLLEFALNEEHFSFPVGRVQFLYMRPLSFHEFLYNLGHQKLLDFLENTTVKQPPDALLHDHLLKFVRQYMLLGGMPAIVNRFLETNSYLECTRLLSALLETYRNDFGKFASKAQFKHLQRFFDKAPLIVSQHFKFVKIDPEARSRELKVALQQLSWTGLIHCVFATSANGIPLHAEIKENKFKLIFLDIGLMQNANKIDPMAILNEDLWQINEGALAEQYVGQELLANSSCYENTTLFFWEREKPTSTAEIDYIMQTDSKIVPIEVKAGNQGRLRSLHQFMKEKRIPLGVKISTSPLAYQDNILYLPFYLMEQMPRLVKENSK